MEPINSTDYFLIILLVWQLILTFVLVFQSSKWRKIVKDGKKINLVQILENIVAKEDSLSKKVTKIENDTQDIKLRTNTYFQKLSLVRFNPFESTGGDQSFIITLLNGQNDGFVISSLHSRSGTRIYAKQISKGSPVQHEFSKEEKEIVDKTIKSKQSEKIKNSQ